MQALAPRADGRGDDEGIAYGGQELAICFAELWRLDRGMTDTTEEAIARLLGMELEQYEPINYENAIVCAQTLETKLRAARGDPDAGEALARLDSIIATAPILGPPVVRATVLTAARLFEENGDLERALRLMRHRSYYSTMSLAFSLREQGRLAALTGDREGAIAAYRHYLILRSDPEPALAEEAGSVRAALAELEAGPD